MSREALVLLVCCCDFRDGTEWLIPSKSLRNAVIRAFPGLFCILRMCAPRRAAAVVRPRGREKSADRRRRILISRLLIIRASVPRRKSPFPAYFKGFPAVSLLIPPYPAFLKYPVSPQEKARFAEYDPEQLVQQIIRLKDKEAKSRLSSCEQELKTYTARLSELERLMQNLYEDKCAGTIPQTVFQTLMHKYEAERAEKSEAIPELERKVKSYLENRTDANRWLAIIRRYTEITELDESILFELVDRIEVGETQKVGGQRICDLRVYYRYVGNVDAALVQEERRQPLEEAI